MTRLELEFDQLPPTPNQLHRMHWSKRHALKKDWVWIVRSKDPNPIKLPCRIHVERRSMGRPLDVPAIFGTLKIPLDAIVGAGVLPDDQPRYVEAVSASQDQVGSEEEQKTIITLSHIDE